MGFFSSDPKWMAVPGSQNLANQYHQWGNSITLDPASRLAKKGIRQWSQGGGEGGYDTGTIGSLMAPMRDSFAVGQRESNRAYGRGALGLMSGSGGPGMAAQMSRLKQLNEQKLGEQQGLAYGQALPGLFSSLSNTLQSGIQNRQQAELAAMHGQGQALGMGHWQQKPSIFDNIMRVGQLGSSIAGMAIGMPGIGSGLPRPSPAGLSGTNQFYSMINSVPRY